MATYGPCQVEGYFRIKGSTEFCIERAIAFAPYAEPLAVVFCGFGVVKLR